MQLMYAQSFIFQQIHAENRVLTAVNGSVDSYQQID